MTTSTPSTVAPADEALAARAAHSAEQIAGFLVLGQLDTIGRPDKLPQDLWPDHDPVVVQAVWDRALAVGYRAGLHASRPRFHRDALDRLRGQLEAAGWQAMAGRAAAVTDLLAVTPVDDGLDAHAGMGVEEVLW